jgi:hypothetical protein
MHESKPKSGGLPREATSYHETTDTKARRGAVCKCVATRASVATIDLMTGTYREARATTKSFDRNDTIVHSTLIHTCRRFLAGAMCIQRFRAHCICKSHYLSQLAAIFIEPGL